MAVLGVLAASAAMSASQASAVVFALSTVKCTGGTNVAFCWENAAKEKLELTGEQSVTLEGKKALFDVLALLTIECEKAKGSGTLLQPTPLLAEAKTKFIGTITYEGCKLITPPQAECTVSMTFATNELEGTLENEKLLEVKPKAGAAYTEIAYENKAPVICPAGFRGLHPVTGTVEFEILTPGVGEEKKTLKSTNETLEHLANLTELQQELTMSFTGLGDKVLVSKEA